MSAPKTIKKAINTLQDLLDIQCNDGNWNYCEYMHGLANGMIVAMSCLTGEEPVFKSEPKVWLKDKKPQKCPIAIPPCSDTAH